jgi:hypothetical protein
MNNMTITRSTFIVIAGAIAIGFAASSAVVPVLSNTAALAAAASTAMTDVSYDRGAYPHGHRNDGFVAGAFALGALGTVLGPTYYVPGYDGSFDGGDPYPYGVRYGHRYAQRIGAGSSHGIPRASNVRAMQER